MIETFEKNGKTIEIHQDENPESPRESMDNLGTMVCFHNRYSLGDTDHDYKKDDYSSWDKLRQQIIKDHRPAAIAPLYMMDHSGITISADAERFRQCDPQGWDWGQIGFAYISREKALSEYGGEHLSPSIKKNALSVLMAEIETYDLYLRGDIYGFMIKDADGNQIDSCCGFYGLDFCKEEAKKSTAF